MTTITNTTAEQISELYLPYLALDMNYEKGRNNNITGKRRRRLTLLIVARFGIISPTIIMWLYHISKHQALEHLNKLEKENLLQMIQTYRSPDNRVYVLSYDGAKYAEELMGLPVYYRSTTNAALQFNANTVHHDLICIFCCVQGLLASNASKKWLGVITEPEFKRLFKSNEVRNVDGVIQEADGSLTAVEMEHSFKNKQAREKILLKFLHGLKAGYYSKIFLFSQSYKVFDDIKRFHTQLFEELPNRFEKRTKEPMLTHDDVDLLKAAIIFRTKFCDEITTLFYT